MMNLYGLYDTEDYEQCVFVGTVKECAKYMNFNTINDVYKYVTKQTKYKRRYEVKKIMKF